MFNRKTNDINSKNKPTFRKLHAAMDVAAENMINKLASHPINQINPIYFSNMINHEQYPTLNHSITSSAKETDENINYCSKYFNYVSQYQFDDNRKDPDIYYTSNVQNINQKYENTIDENIIKNNQYHNLQIKHLRGNNKLKIELYPKSDLFLNDDKKIPKISQIDLQYDKSGEYFDEIETLRKVEFKYQTDRVERMIKHNLLCKIVKKAIDEKLNRLQKIKNFLGDDFTSEKYFNSENELYDHYKNKDTSLMNYYISLILENKEYKSPNKRRNSRMKSKKPDINQSSSSSLSSSPMHLLTSFKKIQDYIDIDALVSSKPIRLNNHNIVHIYDKTNSNQDHFNSIHQSKKNKCKSSLQYKKGEIYSDQEYSSFNNSKSIELERRSTNNDETRIYDFEVERISLSPRRFNPYISVNVDYNNGNNFKLYYNKESKYQYINIQLLPNKVQIKDEIEIDLFDKLNNESSKDKPMFIDLSKVRNLNMIRNDVNKFEVEMPIEIKNEKFKNTNYNVFKDKDLDQLLKEDHNNSPNKIENDYQKTKFISWSKNIQVNTISDNSKREKPLLDSEIGKNIIDRLMKERNEDQKPHVKSINSKNLSIINRRRNLTKVIKKEQIKSSSPMASPRYIVKKNERKSEIEFKIPKLNLNKPLTQNSSRSKTITTAASSLRTTKMHFSTERLVQNYIKTNKNNINYLSQRKLIYNSNMNKKDSKIVDKIKTSYADTIIPKNKRVFTTNFNYNPRYPKLKKTKDSNKEKLQDYEIDFKNYNNFVGSKLNNEILDSARSYKMDYDYDQDLCNLFRKKENDYGNKQSSNERNNGSGKKLNISGKKKWNDYLYKKWNNKGLF